MVLILELYFIMIFQYFRGFTHHLVVEEWTAKAHRKKSAIQTYFLLLTTLKRYNSIAICGIIEQFVDKGVYIMTPFNESALMFIFPHLYTGSCYFIETFIKQAQEYYAYKSAN